MPGSRTRLRMPQSPGPGVAGSPFPCLPVSRDSLLSLSWRASLNDRYGDVIQVQVLALEPSARIGLGDEAPARVVKIDAVLGGVGLPDPLAQRVHLVGGRAERARRLHHAPAR